MTNTPFSWNRIVPASAPLVATEEAAEGEPSTSEGAVFADGFESVGAAGGRETAIGAEEGGQGALIKLYHSYKNCGQYFAHYFESCRKLRSGFFPQTDIDTDGRVIIFSKALFFVTE